MRNNIESRDNAEDPKKQLNVRVPQNLYHRLTMRAAEETVHAGAEITRGDIAVRALTQAVFKEEFDRARNADRFSKILEAVQAAFEGGSFNNNLEVIQGGPPYDECVVNSQTVSIRTRWMESNSFDEPGDVTAASLKITAVQFLRDFQDQIHYALNRMGSYLDEIVAAKVITATFEDMVDDIGRYGSFQHEGINVQVGFAFNPLTERYTLVVQGCIGVLPR